MARYPLPLLQGRECHPCSPDRGECLPQKGKFSYVLDVPPGSVGCLSQVNLNISYCQHVVCVSLWAGAIEFSRSQEPKESQVACCPQHNLFEGHGGCDHLECILLRRSTVMGCRWARLCVVVFRQIPRNMYVDLGKGSSNGSGRTTLIW